MKICFFTQKIKTYKNGAILSLINIANEMANRGIEVILVVPNQNIQYPIINNKIKYITIPAYSMRTRLEDYSLMNKFKEKIKIIYNRFSIRKALKVLSRENLDIIHINGIDSEVGAEVARKLNVPY